MTDQTRKYIDVQQAGGVVEITIQRADKKNALNLAMYQSIAQAIELAESTPEVRVVILTGSEGCFTSGNDLAVFAEPAALLGDDNPIFHFMSVLSACTKPVIACVDGLAIGIGTTLLLHCDLVIASSTAEFKLPFVGLGLTPEYASSVLLPRLVGHVKASEWLLLGRHISAQEALTAGLINCIDVEPLNAARRYAESIVQMPPQAVRQAKLLLKQPMKNAVENAMNHEVALFTEALSGQEFAEAVTAFFEKRQPNFSKFS